jgi:thioesterase domain-containing protein/acyl carrier protein
VKIRGFRIELEEIEQRLMQHPAITFAMVVSREETSGEPYLSAYFVTAPGESPGAEDLRHWLIQTLPEYMCPSFFTRIDEIPLTPNGKIDRRALPLPNQQAQVGKREYAPPGNEIELRLTQLWERIFKSRPIGVTDNFFALGGHSLLALRLITGIRKEFDQELPLSILFEVGDIRGLAAAIRAQKGAMPWSPVVAIQPSGSRTPFFCVHPIGGQVLCFYRLAQLMGQDQPFYGLQAPDLAQTDDEPETIEGFAARYLTAIRAVQPEGPYLLGGYSFGGLVAYELAQQLRAQGQRVNLLAMLDVWSPATDCSLKDLPDDDFFLYGLLTEQVRQRGRAPAITFEFLKRLEPEQQYEFILQSGKQEQILHPETEIEWLRRFVQGYKKRHLASIRYSPRPYNGKITLFRCEEIEPELIEFFQREGINLQNQTLGWDRFTAEGVDIYALPGLHETLYQEPQVNILAEHLQAAIAAAAC